MNYTHILNELKQANVFELYRLSVAINKELENPNRIVAIKKRLWVGMELSYFHHIENRLKQAKLLEIKQKNVLLLDYQKDDRLIVPYFMLNIDGADTEIHETQTNGSLTANNLRVGDCVAFNKDGQTIAGMIKRINLKTVSLVTRDNRRWRVAYSYLHRVHESEILPNILLEKKN